MSETRNLSIAFAALLLIVTARRRRGANARGDCHGHQDRRGPGRHHRAMPSKGANTRAAPLQNLTHQ
jgi:hypothetical protein